MRWFAVLLLLVTVVIDAATARADIIGLNTHAITLTSLGKNVTPTAINNTGIVVGQAANGVAFKWQSGVTTPLGTLGGSTSYANDVNDSGTVVGWGLDGLAKQKAFRYETATGMVNIESSGTLQSSAEAINVNGDIVGWKYSGTSYRSSRWTESNPGGALLFSSINSKAIGINDTGDVVGLALKSDNTPQDGYYWNGVGSSSITSLMGTSYLPYAGINNQPYAGLDYQYTTAGVKGSLASAFNIGDISDTSIPRLLASDTSSIALGLNDQALIVGESELKGFLFNAKNGDLFNINSFTANGDHFDSLLRLTDINNAGQFVGVATLNGESYGFVGSFTAIPEPGTWAILVGGALLVLRQRKRRRRQSKSGLYEAVVFMQR